MERWRLATDRTRSVITRLTASPWLPSPPNARRESSIGFRSAQNAPPYGLRWAPLQPTLLSRRTKNKIQKQPAPTRFLVMVVVVDELCSEQRPTRVLQKPAIFMC